jgi:pyruvate/2-oxoglutarate dehydrogenase complex dihydrolipoamide dehydrogenase (E3) component
LVIGSGQAAVPLAVYLKKQGKKVAIVEGAHIGGSCVNFGCSPTKTIIASARVAHLARRAGDYGVRTGDIDIDFSKVMERQQAIVHQFRGNNTKKMRQNDVELIHAYASFEDAHCICAGDEVFEAEHIYLNTGTQAVVPAIPGLQDVPFLDEQRILELTTLPEHLIILGGGYIGCEYAQAFRRLGSKVTMIDHGEQLLKREDEDIAGWVKKTLADEGVQIILKADVTEVSEQDGSPVVGVKFGNGRAQNMRGSHLMVAVGRTPNTERLTLDRAGIQTDARGYIKVDDHLRTNVPHIWALGDVNGRGAFTHTSYDDYTIIRDNLEGGSLSVSRRILAYGVFTDPPLARIGMNEKAVRASGRKALIGTMPMKSVSRAIEMDETRGMIKVLIDAETEQWLGAAIVGIGGDEALQVILGQMYAQAPYTVLRHTVFIHPTIAELLPTLLSKLQPLE